MADTHDPPPPAECPPPFPSDPRRYGLGEMLGAGGGGEVLGAVDRVIGREVAIKRLHGSRVQNQTAIAQFLREAQISAQLEHPGVLPIYDLAVDDAGAPYFTMRRFAGRTLSEVIAARLHAGTAPDCNELVTIGIRVGEVLAYAHSRSMLHRDVKPDNILIGSYGEVVLIDWGLSNACRDRRGTVVGTPMYMAPEMARGEPGDARSDIYCLGTTLLHAITGRAPLDRADPADFWEAKRAGQVDLPTAAERAGIPPALLAILAKTMAADPGARYPSADALVADLRAFQGGLAVSAMREGPFVRLGRLYRRHRSVVHAVAVAGILSSTLLALWLRERALAHADWRPVLSEDFADARALEHGWRSQLVPDYASVQPVPLQDSGWSVQDGALVGDDRAGRVINLARTDLPGGALRATWTVTSVAGAGNLNCFVGASNRLDGYTVHLGGWGRSDYVAITRGTELLVDRVLERPIESGRTYACALEFDQGRLHLSIDGTVILGCTDPDPIPSSEQGGFGFETSWNSARFDDLRISVKPTARRVSPLDSADALASAGAPARAASAYLGFARTWPDDVLAPTARLRGYRALGRAGLVDEAVAGLRRAAQEGDPVIAAHAHLELLRLLAPGAADTVVDDLIAGLATANPDQTIRRIALSLAGQALLQREPQPSAALLIDTLRRMRRWADRLESPVSDCVVFTTTANKLNARGRHVDVVSLAADCPGPHADALLSLGRFAEVHERYPTNDVARRYAFLDAGRAADGIPVLPELLRGWLLLESGRLQEALNAASDFDRAYAATLLHSPQEALLRLPGQVDAIAHALLTTGRPEAVLELPGLPPERRCIALAMLGRATEAGTLTDSTAGLAQVRGCQAIEALAAGDHARATALAIPPGSYRWNRSEDWFPAHFTAYVLPGLIRWRIDGSDPRTVWRSLRDEQMHRGGLRTDFRWNGLLGDCSAAEILAQPFRGGRHPDVEAALVAAIRADLDATGEAQAAWTAFLALAPPSLLTERAWAASRLSR